MLKSEREESIKRLIKIEKQLSKTKNARRLFTEDDSDDLNDDTFSDDEDTNDQYGRPMLHNSDDSSSYEDQQKLSRSGRAHRRSRMQT